MSDLLTALWTAMTLGLVAAAQPGPFQAYLLSQALRQGRARTLPLAFVPLISDGPIATISLLVLSQAPAGVLRILSVLGGLVVWFLAIESGRAWLREFRTGQYPGQTDADTWDGQRGGFMRAVLVNTLNPGPWTFWSLIIGPLVIDVGRNVLWHSAVVVVGFYLVLVGGLVSLIVAFAAAARLGLRIRRTLQLVATLGLTVFGTLLLVRGFQG